VQSIPGSLWKHPLRPSRGSRNFPAVRAGWPPEQAVPSRWVRWPNAGSFHSATSTLTTTTARSPTAVSHTESGRNRHQSAASSDRDEYFSEALDQLLPFW